MTTSRKLMHPYAGLVSRLRVAMGTFVAIDAHAGSEDVARRGVDAAFEAILTVQRLMHPTRGVDLAALADCAPDAILVLHPWTWGVLMLCERLHRASHGVFDPCLSTAPGRFADLKLLPEHRVTTRAPVHVDLGGIAKGYAVDRAIDALRAAGCSGGLVNAGGDLAVFGPKAHAIVCGTSSHVACGGNASRGTTIIRLRNRALASSDTAAAPRPSEHRGYYHGLDRTRCISGTVTVLAASAALADGLTKCLLGGANASNARLLREFRAEQLAQNASPNPRSKRVKLLFSSNH